MIVIVDYGIGNLDSVLRGFRHAGAEAVVASDPAALDRADGIVLPGVGSFAKGMRNLTEQGLLPALNRRVLEEKAPVLGICLGFQLFTKHSEEGDAEGLGWIDGVTKRFNFPFLDNLIPVPHMGWNELEVRKENRLLDGIHPGACFYFAHSYCVHCKDDGAILATTEYGYDFVSAVERDNIFGTQFHPEKSHANGLDLLRNFVGLTEHA